MPTVIFSMGTELKLTLKSRTLATSPERDSKNVLSRDCQA